MATRVAATVVAAAPGQTTAYVSYIGCEHERAALLNTSPPAEARISTTTAVAKVHNARITHEALYERLMAPGALPMEIDATATATAAKIGGFVGQCSVVFHMRCSGRNVNVKMFHNGSLQLTGVDRPRTGVAAIRAAFELCRRVGVLVAHAEAPPPSVGSYTTVNINTTYDLGFRVDRLRLYRILSDEYGLLAQYEPAFHAGVLLKFFSNTARPAGSAADGLCHCRALLRARAREGGAAAATGEDAPLCIDRRGKGYAPGQCRRITVTFFQSGRVLVNGARTYRQLRETFYFVVGLCAEHVDRIRVEQFRLRPTESDFDVLAL